MINGNLAFLFFASIVFIGFILNALFSKLKIANIMPLMLIGVLIGPLLHIIGTGSGSLVSSLSSLITGVAVSFILFDVGLNMNYAELRKVLCLDARSMEDASASGTPEAHEGRRAA